MTIQLNTKQLIPPAQEHGALAAARIPFIAQGDAAGLANVATQLGFQPVGTDRYQHTDGSWAMLNAGRLERGRIGRIGPLRAPGPARRPAATRPFAC